MEVSHLLVLPLKVAFEEFRDLAQLFFLGGSLFGNFITHGCHILGYLLKAVDKGLLISSVAFNDLIGLGRNRLHVTREVRVYLLFLLNDA